MTKPCCNTSQTPGCSDNQLSVQVLISTNAIEVQLDDLLVVLNDLKVALAGLCDDEGDYLQQISGVLSDIITADNACCNLLAGKLTTLKTIIHNNVHICGEYTTTTTVALCGINGTAECDGTAVIITIVAGEDVGTPLNLYYWKTSTMSWVSMGTVPKALLEAGYTIAVPPTTTKYKIADELGACGTVEEIPFAIECTTTTTPEVVTTTTELPSTTTTEEPHTTTTTLCTDYSCGDGNVTGIYYSNDYHSNDPIYVCSDSAECSVFFWDVYTRPNRFNLYDDSGLIYTTGWKGIANYGGPWGLTLNTAVSGTQLIQWGSETGRRVVVETGPADPLNPTTDTFTWKLECSGCEGDTTTTPEPIIPTQLRCNNFGVGFSNYLPGKSNVWEGWVFLDSPTVDDFAFTIEFEADRNDELGSCTSSVIVTVLTGQVSGTAEGTDCIENIQAESWTVTSWSITAISPDNDSYLPISCPQT